MKTTEEYIDDYLDKYNELSNKGELWRFRVSPQEFIQEIERIREYEIEQKEMRYLTPYHIESNVLGMISIMLMDKVTKEEIIAQFKRHKDAAKEEFAKSAPKIQESIKKIRMPLNTKDIIKIYLGLWRKQVSFDIIDEDVLNEFKKTRQYKRLIYRDNNEEQC